MDLQDTIKRRRSIRRFKPDPVPTTDIEKMVYAASLAPSGGNFQPWHFLAVTDPHKRDGIAKIVHDEGVALSRRMSEKPSLPSLVASLVFSKAPVVFVVLVEPFPLENDPFFSAFQKEQNITGRHIDRYGGFVNVQSVGAAIQNLLLTAYELGYGSCWLRIPYYAKDSLEAFLEVKPPWEILALIPVGIPDHKPTMPPRKPVQKILTYV